jgi:hypothetical protein
MADIYNNFVTVDDVRARYGASWDEDLREIVQVRLQDLQALALTRVSDFFWKLDNLPNYKDIAIKVFCDACISAVKNNDFITSGTEGEISYTVNNNVSSGVVTFSDEEWSLLYSSNYNALQGRRVSIIDSFLRRKHWNNYNPYLNVTWTPDFPDIQGIKDKNPYDN